MAKPKILIGITGSISTYKVAELTRLLRKADYEVEVIMTQGAKKFITPLTIQSLTGRVVREDLFDCEQEATMGHIELGRWADLIVIAPASADIIARLAQGRSDDLLTATCLAAQVPIAIVPAMNQAMWSNPMTQKNVETLKSVGFKIWGPNSGEQACGEFGYGRIIEPDEIFECIEHAFVPPLLKGLRILITAGPTREPIDPVRYVSNYSSGKMGYSIAKAALQMGAQVTLVTGPVEIPAPVGAEVIAVKSALDMQQAVFDRIKEQDIFISAAAVADYRPRDVSDIKIKKTQDTLDIALTKNPDILLSVSQLEQRPFLVGFAAETGDLINKATNKMQAKKLDMIIANDVAESSSFGNDNNEVVVITAKGKQQHFPYQKKSVLATKLLEFISALAKNTV